MAKKKRSDPARTRPLTLEFLRDLGALKGFVPPTGAFDPKGAWTNAYRLWLVQRWRGGGSLTIRREPRGDAGARLHVALAVAEVPGYLRRTRFEVDCAADALATPTSWSLKSENLDADGKPTKGTAFAETGTVGDDAITIRFGERARTEKVPKPVTSNWSLFDTVQRLPGAKTAALRFTLLEELDLVKAGQRLEFRERKDFKLNGRTLPLTGYQQIGQGVLPWQYWVDERGRLLFAFSGVRAYIHDPKAEAWMHERLEKAREWTKRRRAK